MTHKSDKDKTHKEPEVYVVKEEEGTYVINTNGGNYNHLIVGDVVQGKVVNVEPVEEVNLN